MLPFPLKKCAHSCIGELCPTPKDCGFNESCCGRQSNLPGKCAKSCIGRSCKDNQQCGKGNTVVPLRVNMDQIVSGNFVPRITTVRQVKLADVGIPSLAVFVPILVLDERARTITIAEEIRTAVVCAKRVC